MAVLVFTKSNMHCALYSPGGGSGCRCRWWYLHCFHLCSNKHQQPVTHSTQYLCKLHSVPLHVFTVAIATACSCCVRRASLLYVGKDTDMAHWVLSCCIISEHRISVLLEKTVGRSFRVQDYEEDKLWPRIHSNHSDEGLNWTLPDKSRSWRACECKQHWYMSLQIQRMLKN